MTKKIKGKYIPISIEADNDGHTFFIPLHLAEQFRKDVNNNELTESGEFDTIYGEYRVGGCLSQIPLFMYSEK